MGNRRKLMDCSLREKYKPLLINQQKNLYNFIKRLPFNQDGNDKDWQRDAKQIIEEKFFELINDFNEMVHGHLAGYLKTGLESFCIDYYRKQSAQKARPEKGFTNVTVCDKKTKEEKIVTIDETPPEKQLPDLDLLLSSVSNPEEFLGKKEEQSRLEKTYQKIEDDLSPETKKFLQIWKENPDETEKVLAGLMGISTAMVKKHKVYIREKANKYKKYL